MPRDLLFGNSPTTVMVAGAFAAAILVLVWLVRTLARRRLARARTTPGDVDDLLLDLANRTKIFLLALPILYVAVRTLAMPRDLGRILRAGAGLSFIAQNALWVIGLVDFWIRRYRRTRAESDPGSATIIDISRIAAVVAVWAVAVVIAIDNLGFDVTTLIAGLGIGGVAVALALQNILGDLFASLSIVVDKPFVIGDAIQIDNHVGTVEHIGLKTTRLRASTGEELIVGNGDLLKSRIRNFKRMQERRALFRLPIAHGTPVAKLERIPLLVRSAIEQQSPRARFDRAHLAAVAEAGIELEAVYFVTTPEYHDYADVHQAVLLDVLRAFAAEEIDVAHTPKTVVVAG